MPIRKGVAGVAGAKAERWVGRGGRKGRVKEVARGRRVRRERTRMVGWRERRRGERERVSRVRVGAGECVLGTPLRMFGIGHWLERGRTQSSAAKIVDGDAALGTVTKSTRRMVGGLGTHR